jgi:hypothetical protein
VLLCVHIRPGESPASALMRAAAAATIPVGDTSGGLPGWILSWGGQAVRDGAGPALESSYCAAGAEVCGRLMGGMQAAVGGIAAAAGEGALVLTRERQMRIRLSACISSVQGLQGVVDQLGRDLLQAGEAGGPKLPVEGEAGRLTSVSSAEARQQREKTEANQVTQARVELARVELQVEAATAKDLDTQRGERVPTAADGVSADAEGTTAVKFDEAADDDELLLRVFNDMDTNGDNIVSREELDKALEPWTSNRELVEALQGAVQGVGTGIKFDTFKKMVNQVRAREQSKLGEAEGSVRMDMRG